MLILQHGVACLVLVSSPEMILKIISQRCKISQILKKQTAIVG